MPERESFVDSRELFTERKEDFIELFSIIYAAKRIIAEENKLSLEDIDQAEEIACLAFRRIEEDPFLKPEYEDLENAYSFFNRVSSNPDKLALFHCFIGTLEGLRQRKKLFNKLAKQALNRQNVNKWS